MLDMKLFFVSKERMWFFDAFASQKQGNPKLLMMQVWSNPIEKINNTAYLFEVDCQRNIYKLEAQAAYKYSELVAVRLSPSENNSEISNKTVMREFLSYACRKQIDRTERRSPDSVAVGWFEEQRVKNNGKKKPGFLEGLLDALED